MPACLLLVSSSSSSSFGANRRLMRKRVRNPVEHLELALMGAGIATYSSLLDHCGQTKSLLDGKRVHRHIIDNGHGNDTFISNLVMQMYIRCGSLENARQVFDLMPKRSVVSWTTIITAYVQNDHPEEALKLSWLMELDGLKPDKVTFLCLAGVCSSLGSLHQSKKLHLRLRGEGFDHEIPIENALISMFARCGSLDDATTIFTRMPRKNVVSWNSIIAAYVDNLHPEEAFQAWKEALMVVKPDGVTFINVLRIFACADQLPELRQIHGKAVELKLEDDVAVATAVLSAYGKCGSAEEARVVFDKLPRRNVVAWNAMMSAYNTVHRPQEALDLFKLMKSQYVQPDHVTFTTVLASCGSIGLVDNGKRIHDHIKVFDLVGIASSAVTTALVNMYNKCGSVKDARAAFDSMTNKDLVAWNAMIAGYAQAGQLLEAAELFEKMSVEPDEITFLSLLDACCHGCVFGDGWKFFRCMLQRGIKASVKHYGCLVCLLGKAGRLAEAEQLIFETPGVEMNAIVWKIYLDACRSHNDVERAARAAANVLRLEPESSLPYVVLADLCFKDQTQHQQQQQQQN